MTTNIAFESTIPVALAEPPVYEVLWLYLEPAPQYETHAALYTITVTLDETKGDILLRSWIEAKYKNSISMTVDPVFEGAQSFFRNAGSILSIQNEYVIT